MASGHRPQPIRSQVSRTRNRPGRIGGLDRSRSQEAWGRARIAQADGEGDRGFRVGGAGAPASASAAPSASTARTAIERRPITVLFCHFEGPALPAQFDVEDWRDLYGRYVDAARATVERFDGRPEPELGDSLMAVFGAPQAQENDAERAVRAALAIQQAIDKLSDQSPPGAPKLSARIGLECGNVVVDAVGGVFGKATSIAARVQAAAEPGSILVTANVLRQVADCSSARMLASTGSRACPKKSISIVSSAPPRVAGERRRGLRPPLPAANGNSPSFCASGARPGGRRPARSDRRRARHRQVAASGGIPDAALGNAPHLARVERVTVPARCYTPPDC